MVQRSLFLKTGRNRRCWATGVRENLLRKRDNLWAVERRSSANRRVQLPQDKKGEGNIEDMGRRWPTQVPYNVGAILQWSGRYRLCGRRR